MRRTLSTLATTLVVAACADPAAPAFAPPEPPPTGAPAPVTAPQLFARFVALGTSNSMGVQSAGISAAAQGASWPAQLAARVAGATFTQPLVQDPGCSPPLAAPLVANLALLGAFTALGGGDDLVSAVMTTCAPLRAGLVPPLNNVAISGADVHDALFTTVEAAAARSARVGTLYARVLAPGQTQVTAMLAQRPTFVSVELAANDVLPASTGRIEAMTPFAAWAADYDQVLAAVASTGARAVLVGLPTDAAQFPSIRQAREFFAESAALRTLGVTVSASCERSTNHLFVPGYLLTLLSRAPATATCEDVPGAADHVLTADDVRAINARMAQMNAHMQARAAERGYAYFALSAVYDLPKPTFRVADLLLSSAPFGPNISLDGVHPSARGQGLLAAAAAQAIGARYAVAIP
jgi:hypothetical protein